jgi:hypothetical protein
MIPQLTIKADLPNLGLLLPTASRIAAFFPAVAGGILLKAVTSELGC